MICATCGSENERGRKFCLECGTRLAVGCPSCGATNTPGAKFCGECGTTLGADAVAGGGTPSRTAPAGPSASPRATAAPAPVAERRIVSILFADLVGFTALAEGRDPEETRELLSRYFELARDVIGRYGGTVEKFIGDAVMAVWGTPTAHEDDAERAVRAGLELVGAVGSLGPGIAARAGVLTGEAAVTLAAVAGSSGEGMVAGDLVNTASRLQSAAPPGAVLVGEATQRAASRAVIFEEAGEQVLKGKASPVPAWRAVRVVAEVGGRNRSEALEAPFVGRDEELRLLKDLFHATGRDGRARLVSVLGPAGIGKSRLAWEFLKYVDGLVETLYWHDGRSPAYGDGITFWALGEMVRERCGLLATDDESTTRAKVRQAVERWITDEPERRWVEPALLALLGVGTAPASGDELFSMWRTFFERIAAEATVVMVFEDLHWADAGLLDFIDHMLEWSRGLPIYIVTLARPELLERRPSWGAGKRNFTSLSLEPMPEPAMRELLAGLVPGLPAALVKAIVARADGIPLYAVETVRMLLAEGRLVEEAGAYRPVGVLADLAVPETLQALISARLDGLEPADRSLLQDAAVLGQSFTIDGLAAVSGAEAATLEPRLRALVRRELLILEADPRSPERGQYAFIQALIREVAYSTLARADRKSRHLAAARWFEALDEGELAGALAAQYLAAYRSAPEGAEADALAGQARLALKGAADRAASLGSHRQALGFLRLALEATSDPAEIATLRERAADAAANDADFDAARAYAEDAIAWYRSAGDRIGVARATTALGITLNNMSQPVAAAKVMEDAFAETADLEAEPDVVRLVTELARAYANGQDARALATADRALAAAERLELTPTIAEALLNRALALALAGRLQEPIALLRGVLALSETHGLVLTRLRALNNLGASLSAEDLQATHQISRETIELARRLGIRSWLVNAIQGQIGVAIWVGEWAEADRLIDEVDPSELPAPVAVSFGENVAILQALRGDLEAADRTMAGIAPLRATIDDPRSVSFLRLNESLIHLLAGRFDAAYASGLASAELGLEGSVYGAEQAVRAALLTGDAKRARKALDIHLARPDRGRMISADRLYLGAGVRALEGDPGGALGDFRSAAGEYRDLGLPVSLGFCLVMFAVVLGPDVPEARAAADGARELLTRLGSPTLLARLDDGLARWAGRSAAPRDALVRSAGQP
jgi:class 3 adenylate cyclase/tetratricopeptide (TPR) repeat protein